MCSANLWVREEHAQGNVAVLDDLSTDGPRPGEDWGQGREGAVLTFPLGAMTKVAREALEAPLRASFGLAQDSRPDPVPDVDMAR